MARAVTFLDVNEYIASLEARLASVAPQYDSQLSVGTPRETAANYVEYEGDKEGAH